MIKKLLMISLTIISTLCICGSVSALDSSIYSQISYNDLSGNPISTANPGDNIYGLIYVHNSMASTSVDLNMAAINNPDLTYMETYQTSYDNGVTWNVNDGTFNPQTGWQITSMSGGNIYMLRQLFQVTNPSPDLTTKDGEMTIISVLNVPIPEDIQITTESTIYKKINLKAKSSTLSKITALSKATLNPTTYAALLKMNKRK